jgi:hypothetical protein
MRSIGKHTEPMITPECPVTLGAIPPKQSATNKYPLHRQRGARYRSLGKNLTDCTFEIMNDGDGSAGLRT